MWREPLAGPLVSAPVTVSREISASPEQLYAMVCDLTRMGEWSPENEGGEWLGTSTCAEPGARFRGSNRAGKKSWKGLVTVVEALPGKRFSFRVTAGPVKVAEWSYTFDAAPNGCRVTESWTDMRPGWFKPIGSFATGVSDREAHNRNGMKLTLQRLAAAAESLSGDAPL